MKIFIFIYISAISSIVNFLWSISLFLESCVSTVNVDYVSRNILRIASFWQRLYFFLSSKCIIIYYTFVNYYCKFTFIVSLKKHFPVILLSYVLDFLFLFAHKSAFLWFDSYPPQKNLEYCLIISNFSSLGPTVPGYLVKLKNRGALCQRNFYWKHRFEND